MVTVTVQGRTLKDVLESLAVPVPSTPAVVGSSCCYGEGAPAVGAAGIFDRPRPILERFKDRIIDGLIGRGVPREKAVEAVAELGDRPILEWLFMGGGLLQIIEAILKLIGAFG